MDVSDLLSQQVNEDLGSDRIPTAAVLIVETMQENGQGLRFYTAGTTTWHAHGMLTSTLRRLEHHDLEDWLGDPD